MTILTPNQSALANDRPAGQLGGSGHLSVTVAANWAFLAAVAELQSFAKMTSLRIRSALWGWLVALTLLTAGCVSSRAKIVSPQQLPLYGSDPLYHTVYVGSDDRYHHFKWSRGLLSGEFLVDRGALHLSRVFSSGAGKAFLTRTADGSVDVLVLQRKGEQDGAANRSQPVSPDSTPTPGSAGSHWCFRDVEVSGIPKNAVLLCDIKPVEFVA